MDTGMNAKALICNRMAWGHCPRAAIVAVTTVTSCGPILNGRRVAVNSELVKPAAQNRHVSSTPTEAAAAKPLAARIEP